MSKVSEVFYGLCIHMTFFKKVLCPIRQSRTSAATFLFGEGQVWSYRYFMRTQMQLTVFTEAEVALEPRPSTGV